MRVIAIPSVLVALSVLLMATAAAAQDCGECTESCFTGGEFGHIATQGGGGFAGVGAGWHLPDQCEPGSCQDNHHPCMGCALCEEENSPETLGYSEALDILPLAESDPGVALTVLRTYPQNVEYNVRRHALQVLSCEGQVIAHVSLPEPSRPAFMAIVQSAQDFGHQP